MILEYTASAALAEMRALAAPVSLGTAVLSRGAEEHAAFSPQAARGGGHGPEVPHRARVRTGSRDPGLRQRGVQPAGTRLRFLYDLGLSRLPADDEDRPLDTDIAAAEEVIAALADS